MHELSLCENILQMIEQQAKDQQFTRVLTVFLEIGQLSGVEPEAISFCFDAVMAGSVAAHAKLVIVPQVGLAWCAKCYHHFEIQHRYDECPICGSYEFQIKKGEHLRISELEVI
ncbi:MAG: hydrogenase maturation nickel metallochaperone HypA [Methylovulum sp.]|nr:hydrogenase maturation nickel metallochaperone HypA [Methylovulum sp.]TSA39395.1 MAG: hydrogenase maturation nickel metallochaperone HypA [Methylococcaceae bacterium]